jgi:hypothetical protein
VNSTARLRSHCAEGSSPAHLGGSCAQDDEQQAEPTSDPALALPAKQQAVGLGSNE